MRLPRNWMSRSFTVVVCAVLLYVVLAVVTGWDDFRSELAHVPAALVAPLVALSLVNYLLRFWRWQLLLAAMDVRVPVRWSAILYFATYVMVITPGKIGEVFKAGVLRDRRGIHLARGLPAVLAERVYDFLGVLLLAAFGLAFWPVAVAGVHTALASALAVPLVLVILRSARVRGWLLRRAQRTPFLRDQSLRLEEALSAFAELLAPGLALATLLLSAVAWSAECLSLWLVCRELDLAVTLGEAFFIYAAGTLVGSLSFLPGGLGGTEAVIVALLLALSVPASTGLTVAVVVRLATLWLAVVIGMMVFLPYRRRLLEDV